MLERATRFLWRAAGSPVPFETDGTPIRPRGSTGLCAGCGEPAEYLLKDAISDNWGTVANLGRAWPYGGNAVCAACVWCCKSLALRAGLCFVKEQGFWFTPSRPIAKDPSEKTHLADVLRRPDPLSAILSPPDPPFVALYPIYGIDHGTEANSARIPWPGCPVPVNPLIKCQSKHTALYATIATSSVRYPLQVDNTDPTIVHVPLWIELRTQAEALLADLRALGVGAEDARGALCKGRPPPKCPLSLARDWPARTRTMTPHCGAPWFDLFVNLLPMPERGDSSARKRNEDNTA